MPEAILEDIRVELNARECSYLEHRLHYQHIEPEVYSAFDISGFTEVELARVSEYVVKVNNALPPEDICYVAWYIQEIAVITHDKEQE